MCNKRLLFSVASTTKATLSVQWGMSESLNYQCFSLGPGVAQWLRRCATIGWSRDRFPVVSLDFSLTYSFRPHLGPGFDSTSKENEYQENFLGVKAASALGWQPYHLHVPSVLKIWEPKPPGTIWVTPALLLDYFNFTFTFYQCFSD
jgi:hypothetical protein